MCFNLRIPPNAFNPAGVTSESAKIGSQGIGMPQSAALPLTTNTTSHRS